jgi:acetylornithine deacetylase/succinyl-diaminopimelate desuccinylase-like protein
MNPALEQIDWKAVTAEASELLRDYIRINTTNPPGGEEAGALFLRDLLAKDGIASTLYDAGDSRVSLAARLEGTGGSGKPIVLLSHIDVVPVEQEHWEHDAFGGDIVDDVIWGRGTLDMKGMGIMELMIMLLARRHGLELPRDLLFVAVADEEEGGARGVKHLQEKAPELFDVDFVFNEGAYGFSNFMGKETKMFGICPSEKSPCWVKLRTKGAPGHASVPHGKNALVRLVNALARVEAREKRARLTDTVEAMIRTLKNKGFVPDELDLHDQATLEAVGAADAHIGAITHDTVSLTGVHSGHKHNVIPVTAESTLDCRLLPDTNPDEFLRELAGIIDDPEIEIIRVLEHDSGTSSLDTPVASIVSEVVAERYGEEGCVVPMLSPGFTDSHAFRAAGAEAYGFTPALLTREELATIHGHNERISIGNLGLGTEVLFDVVTRLASKPV